MTEAEWNTCANPTPMLEFLRGKASERKLRLFAAGYCRRIWHLMPADQSRRAVEMAEFHVDGNATRRHLTEAKSQAEVVARAGTRWMPARSAAWAAVWIAAGGGGWLRAVETAREATVQEAAQRAWDSFKGQGVDTCYDASEAARRETTWSEQARLSELLRHIVGNPFNPDPARTSWSVNVTNLAQALYVGDDNRLILADALEEAGHVDLAGHFRQEEWHPKGCWALDLVLGKV